MSTRGRIRQLGVGSRLAAAALLISSTVGSAIAPATASSARAARTSTLNETGQLHLTSKHNFTLNEQGTATGTARGTIYVHLTLVSSSRAKAEVNIYPKGGGSITGYATAGYTRHGSTAVFSGRLSIAHGSGSYARIRGSGLSFSGEIHESNKDAITVHLSGTVSD
jgi:hypothetical protein